MYLYTTSPALFSLQMSSNVLTRVGVTALLTLLSCHAHYSREARRAHSSDTCAASVCCPGGTSACACLQGRPP